jgi:RNA polymerase sigma-70 factor (sigma-E family)
VALSDDGRDTFTAWAMAARPRLVRTAYLLTGDQGRAEDLVQQVLLKIAVRWTRLRDGNVDGYARTVLYRDQVSWWRKKRDVISSVPSSALRAAGDDLGTSVDRVLVMQQALARLTPKQRAVLVLRFYDDLSERDTAEVLGVSPGTVKSQTSAALRQLREHAPEVRVLLGMEESDG